MRITSVMPQRVQAADFNNSPINKTPVSHHTNYTNSTELAVNPALLTFAAPLQKSGGILLTFTGKERNLKQGFSLGFENIGTGMAEDYQGGMGVVTYEGPTSMIKHEGLDLRNISPFHEHNNSKGGYRFLYTKNIELVDGKLPETIEARHFVSAAPGQTIEEFARALNYDVKDLRYVIQSEPDGHEATSKSKYCLIEPTSAHGEFERMSDHDIGKIQKIKYALFKISEDNPSYNKLKSKPNYWMYTQELAKTTKPYSYGPHGNGGIDAEIINSDFCRAVLKAGEQMDTEEFGHFRPGFFWLHDRPVASFLSHMADLSAAGDENYNGTISHFTMHNPRRPYQGTTDDPFAFARILFSPEDVKALREHPDYELLQNFNAKGWNNLSDAEKTFVRNRFDPFIGRFKDFFGTYNITKIAIEAKKTNPKNVSIGTVSPAFDKQMKDPNMDVAPGLGDDLRKIKTTSPLNGSTPANLGLGNNTSDFGRGSNTLSERKSGFTPLIYNGNNIKELIENREKNAIWLTDILKEAEKEGQNAVNKVFFNDLQISQGRGVIGSISNYKKGDVLVVGWGRPDPQKGFPISLQGALKFFKREDISKDVKQNVHFMFGWGDLPFDKEDSDFKLIMNAYNEIIQLDNGAYKKNIMLVNGRFPNKLVGCTTHGLFTSRDEICGITPFEAKSAAVPYTTTAAGGPKDYTNSKNGWLTKTAPEMNPEFDGLTWDTPPEVIDDARIARSSDEVSDCIKDMVVEYNNDKKSYIARCKKNIEEKYDWHNNGEFNGGKSANKMYREDIWRVDEGWEARDNSPMKRLIGSIGEKCEQIKEAAKETLANPKGSKWTKTAAIITVSTLAAVSGGGAYFYFRNRNKKAKLQKIG